MNLVKCIRHMIQIDDRHFFIDFEVFEFQEFQLYLYSGRFFNSFKTLSDSLFEEFLESGGSVNCKLESKNESEIQTSFGKEIIEGIAKDFLESQPAVFSRDDEKISKQVKLFIGWLNSKDEKEKEMWESDFNSFLEESSRVKE